MAAVGVGVGVGVGVARTGVGVGVSLGVGVWGHLGCRRWGWCRRGVGVGVGVGTGVSVGTAEGGGEPVFDVHVVVGANGAPQVWPNGVQNPVW